MERGYVKLWRKTLDSGLLQNGPVLQVFMYLLLNASHKHTRLLKGATPVTLESGQILTGRKKIAQECKLSEQNVRTAIKILKNLEILTIKSTKKYSIISLINWDTYQQETSSSQPSSQPTANHQVTNSQPTANHIQECKNVRNKKEEKIHCASGDAPQAQNEPEPGSAAWKKKKRAEAFDQFWDAFAYKKGKGGAEKAWNAIPQLTDELLQKILEAARKEAAQRPALIEAGRTPKMAQGWISERRWEDDYGTLPVASPPQHKSFAELEEERNREDFLRMVKERREREAANG